MQRKKQTETLYQFLNSIILSVEQPNWHKFQEAYNTIEDNYSLALSNLYRDPETAFLEDMDLTTIINFNRELLSSNKSMILAIKEISLNEKQNLEFNEGA